MPLTQHKIRSLESQLAALNPWRERGERIVFTNGCFDLLHLGHVDYLEKARQLGDRLIVGLNDDISVRRLKGEDRPLKSVETRARLLAAMEFVDGVVIFAEDTPLRLIETLQPDVLVKGGDYQIGEIVGHEFVLARGGEVLTIPLVEGHSSTDLIKKASDS